MQQYITTNVISVSLWLLTNALRRPRPRSIAWSIYYRNATRYTTEVFSLISWNYNLQVHLWIQLPVSFHQPCINHSPGDVPVFNSSTTCSPLSASHIRYFIPGSKLTFSTNLFHHCQLAPTWTAVLDYTGPDLLSWDQ